MATYTNSLSLPPVPRNTPARLLVVAGGLALASVLAWLWPEMRAFTLAQSYLPHAYCFLWNKHLVMLHAVSDALIGLSYVAISGTLGWIVYRNRKLIPFGWMLAAFGTFIVACGATHFLDVLVLWRPFYWMEGEAKLFTAVVSVTTAVLLPPLAPKLTRLLRDAQHANEASRVREQAHAFTRAIIDSSSFTILVTDNTGRITRVNPAAERLLWHQPQELQAGTNIVDLYDPQELSSAADRFSAELNTPVQQGFDTLTARARRALAEEGEWTFLRKDGQRVPVHVTVTQLPPDASLDGDREEDGTFVGGGYMFTAFDITERLRSQEYIRHIATHDSLTGLPSRILFRDRLEVALARAKRFGERVAVLMVDLDNFKRINDSLGHHAGDEALITIAHRLRDSVRRTDTVARMGGDEFMVILCDVKEEMVETLAQNVLKALSAPLQLGTEQVYITASVGVCIDPQESDPVALLKRADLALYKAKSDGKNQIHRYTADMEHASVERLQTEGALRAAVQRGELHLQFQPQVSLRTGEMIGVEALVRWPRDGKLVPPGLFIPLAEETGLIVPMGDWVLNHALEEGMRLRRQLGRDLLMAVNISPRQFKNRNILHTVKAALERTGFPATCLELEITENILMQATPETLDTIREIRELGIRVALDDFGTGFSSMSYITRMQIDRIKIDQSFVRGVLKDRNSLAVIAAMIVMAHELGMNVIAEGTETADEAQCLQNLGCDDAQGYLFSRPVEANQLLRLDGIQLMAPSGLLSLVAAD